MKNKRKLWMLLGIMIAMIIVVIVGIVLWNQKSKDDKNQDSSKTSQSTQQKDKSEEEELTLPGTDGVFTMYFSGHDVFGDVSTTSRSDVNILAVVNMNTNKILLVSTPRDYYVPLSISDGQCDKLTHAGIYGIDCSVDILEMLYGIDIDYYFRVNFTGFENIIDALGGITVWSDNDFTVEPIKHYVQGNNDLNGIESLAFVRERHALANGDNGRGINQMNVIQAVLDKVTSPNVLTDSPEVLEAFQSNCETSMSYDEIVSLVKWQLENETQWEIEKYCVTGTGDTKSVYSISSNAVYVMVPNQDTVAEATKKMTDLLNDK